MTAFHKVQAVSGALIVLCFLTAAPASGQAVTQDEAARAIALLKKGPPPRIPPDEWRTLRLVLIAGLGVEPASSAVAVPFLIETLTDPDPEIVAAAAGSLLKLDPAKSSANAAAALMRV